MIKQTSIEEIKDKADLTELMGRYTDVKHKKACCPFHNEKSPSLVIYHNETYKCFGCGKSGDVFSLIQEQEKLSFYEAIKWVANYYNLTIEYDQTYEKESQETKDLRTEMFAVTKWAHEKYTSLLSGLPIDASAIQYLEGRGYSEAKRRYWGLGFAPDEWKTITTPLINMGKYQAALEVGIVQTSQGSSYDFMRNRITIPIHDTNGLLVGLAGRLLPPINKGDAKYYNPKESLIYNKKKVLYGLWQATPAIKERGFVYVTEGYLDVQAMHDAGMQNCIGVCGTEMDASQIKFLKRYTEHFVLAFDGDIAGTTKMMKLIDECLKQDIKLSVLELPDLKDPDEYIRYLMNEEKLAV